ncbi:C4-dicarboxylate ABC transporter substrate-binding protein [Desulfuromonas versatilis]|uniref:C4-dicarboxylate ABC transporter substrate-binding protein n=1 Tax=Desulfuromonas versatilis TaxID=2802975 RepID=A0ABN6DVI1_9BACT|nr:TAXI family TRAP transporter solute-binding subunit [Desulfuromonas versatilis]BCR04118.1 C4-dicarboxylate ABC transporter substrate-binding protein [Desulfuromonas versatilis]
MKRSACIIILTLNLLLLAPLTIFGQAVKLELIFSGGPTGGTFDFFSAGIAEHLSRNAGNLVVINRTSPGSVENIRRVNAGAADFAIVYAGDLFLARQGKLPQDQKKYEGVLAMASLYDAPAHLVTLRSSGIDSVAKLVGKRVAVGGVGSGAAASAERYFRSLDLWSRIEPRFIGYSHAAKALAGEQIDALWILAGVPNSAVVELAASHEIRFLDIPPPAEEADFSAPFPFYSEVLIPAGTYPGQDRAVQSFQDTAVWVAGKQLRAEQVSAALREVFSAAGLVHLARVKTTARQMPRDGGLENILTPLHPGAEHYWDEQATASALPRD